MIDSKSLQALQMQLKAAQRVLIVSHIRPDGDSIGSLLGMGLTLEAAGKDVCMVSPDGVPANFIHLDGSNKVVRKAHGEFDYICVLDCSDLSRVGAALDNYGHADMNIDHHITNLEFARVNLVDKNAVATAEILVDLLPAMDFPLTQDAGKALLTGLITDTIGFRTANMTPKALRVAASLMEMGLDLPDLYRRALLARSFEAARLWGAGLSHVQREGSLIWSTISTNDRKNTGYSGWDDADLVNILASVEDVNIAMILMEQIDDRIKVSWRSLPGYDVSGIAVSFGGGGHPNASGAEIPGCLEDVENSVIQATRRIVDGASLEKIR